MTNSAKTLQAPTPDMLEDKTALYRFLLEIYNRTGGPNAKVDIDLSGLKVSVQELNMLSGIKIGKTVQEQIDEKIKGTVIPSIGTITD